MPLYRRTHRHDTTHISVVAKRCLAARVSSQMVAKEMRGGDRGGRAAGNHSRSSDTPTQRICTCCPARSPSEPPKPFVAKLRRRTALLPPLPPLPLGVAAAAVGGMSSARRSFALFIVRRERMILSITYTLRSTAGVSGARGARKQEAGV